MQIVAVDHRGIGGFDDVLEVGSKLLDMSVRSPGQTSCFSPSLEPGDWPSVPSKIQNENPRRNSPTGASFNCQPRLLRAAGLIGAAARTAAAAISRARSCACCADQRDSRDEHQ